jgi:catechol 2,3-dioxygenase-like lactoylglutathione lyase family enzyme
MLSTLDHAVIVVDDLTAAKSDYSALLGLRPSWHGTHPSVGTANVLYRLANAYLELLSIPEKGSHPFASSIAGDDEGLRALAFGTKDIEAAASTLERTGLKVSSMMEGTGVDSNSGAERRWRTAFIDPDGTAGVNLFVIQHLDPPDALPMVEPEDPNASVTGLDHVVIFTGDADEAVGTYRDQLGLDLRLDKTFEEWGMRLMFFRVGDVIVELANHLDQQNQTDRFWGLSYKVADVTRARARLRDQGFDVSEVRDGRRPGTRVITVRSRTHGVATLMISA